MFVKWHPVLKQSGGLVRFIPFDINIIPISNIDIFFIITILGILRGEDVTGVQIRGSE
jgi:hypothetical protein